MKENIIRKKEKEHIVEIIKNYWSPEKQEIFREDIVDIFGKLEPEDQELTRKGWEDYKIREDEIKLIKTIFLKELYKQSEKMYSESHVPMQSFSKKWIIEKILKI